MDNGSGEGLLDDVVAVRLGVRSEGKWSCLCLVDNDSAERSLDDVFDVFWVDTGFCSRSLDASLMCAWQKDLACV